jgi:hypothetical protein
MPAYAQAADVLTQAAVFAGQAPSIHNTQPWRWRVDGDVLDLLLERGRVLKSTDPYARLAILSCGAALHHARIQLAASGWQPTVRRLPESADADHLASLHLDDRIPAEPVAARLVQAAARRHTDRRSTPSAPVDFDRLRIIGVAMQSEGAELKLLHPIQVFKLAKAADLAQRVEADDPDRQAELADWVPETRTLGTGIPGTALPPDPYSIAGLGRTLRRAGATVIAESHHHASVFAIMHGSGDEPADWLAAGEALSAGWLTATHLDVSVLPLSSVVEVASSRDMIRRLLGRSGFPYLVLRFAARNPADDRSLPTPRMPAEATIERH